MYACRTYITRQTMFMWSWCLGTVRLLFRQAGDHTQPMCVTECHDCMTRIICYDEYQKQMRILILQVGMMFLQIIHRD